MAAKNSIDLETDPRSIIGTRVFEAPRDLVFSAWTDPKHLAQWWGPNGFTTTTHSFEFRPGGSWRFVMHGPDGRDYQNRITFDEIVPPERILYRHGGGDDVEPVQFTQAVTFEDLGNGQTRLTWHGKFPSAEERTRVIREYGADKGLVQTMARLADYAAALVAERA
ncbi:MAG: SRPBCC family protein [Xanthobacteraceae bacterium]